ncbi:hypothetical protein KC19_VG194100 [Ceratodon purpureus]|uniref:Uncharacterized protein n=1 Tax=Ceratodon purpureus TaxID=3225 RepID=A0A8T0HSW2_CERPU|nr:hypothetical protein KC19_VG194100 [Ceratodon purpureus]
MLILPLRVTGSKEVGFDVEGGCGRRRYVMSGALAREGGSDAREGSGEPTVSGVEASGGGRWGGWGDSEASWGCEKGSGVQSTRVGSGLVGIGSLWTCASNLGVDNSLLVFCENGLVLSTNVLHPKTLRWLTEGLSPVSRS